MYKKPISGQKPIIVTFVVLLCFLSPKIVFSQQNNLGNVYIPREIIDIPVAGTLQQAQFGLGLRVYPNGGVLTDLSIGIIDRIFAVLYYGGENLIGEGDVNWNPRLGIDIRFRIVDENLVLPGIAVGINTQGFGGYLDKTDRYAIKSRGIYVVGSRNYTTIIGDLGIHIGANLTFERNDKDKDLNFFGGTNVGIKSFGELLLEYDLGINDNDELSIGSNKGYFNAGFRFFISDYFHLTFHLKNLFKNTQKGQDFGREIRIEYRNSFSN